MDPFVFWPLVLKQCSSSNEAWLLARVTFHLIRTPTAFTTIEMLQFIRACCLGSDRRGLNGLRNYGIMLLSDRSPLVNRWVDTYLNITMNDFRNS